MRAGELPPRPMCQIVNYAAATNYFDCERVEESGERNALILMLVSGVDVARAE